MSLITNCCPITATANSKYNFLGRIYEMKDFDKPTKEVVARLQIIIDEAFGRTATRTIMP